MARFWDRCACRSIRFTFANFGLRALVAGASTGPGGVSRESGRAGSSPGLRLTRSCHLSVCRPRRSALCWRVLGHAVGWPMPRGGAQSYRRRAGLVLPVARR